MMKVIAAAALTALGLAVAADAKDESQMALMRAKVIGVSVSYADLDLSRTADARAMLGRIRQAASRACGAEGPVLHERGRYTVSACVRQAVADAVVRLNAPLVTALHEDGAAA